MTYWKQKIDDFLEKGFEEDESLCLGTEVNPMQVVKYLKSKGFEEFDDDGDKRHHIIELVKDGYTVNTAEKTVTVIVDFADVNVAVR